MKTIEGATLEEVESMKKAGMRQVTPRWLDESLEVIGYKLKHSFNYNNVGNSPRKWKAKSVEFIDTRTGKGFANIEANKDKLPELQEIRFNNFVFQNGRIWEL